MTIWITFRTRKAGSSIWNNTEKGKILSEILFNFCVSYVN